MLKAYADPKTGIVKGKFKTPHSGLDISLDCSKLEAPIQSNSTKNLGDQKPKMSDALKETDRYTIDSPGIYRFYNREDVLIYVGKAKTSGSE